jgi:hypothetical protein
MVTGAEILKINKPEDLFSDGNETVIKEEYKAFARRFHPDKRGGDNTIFTHINTLKDKAFELLNKGIWTKNGTHVFETVDGSAFRIKYRFRGDFDLGEMYITDTKVIYFIEKKYKSLYNNYLGKMNFEFKGRTMESEFRRFLPMVAMHNQTKDHYVVAITKTPDVVPLSGIHSLFPEGLDPKHVAWIMSSLCNLLCYINWSGRVHLGISLDSCFASHKHHSIVLIGGWFYTKNITERISQVTPLTYKLMTEKQRINKVADHCIDTELVKHLGRTLMGKHMSKMKYPELSPMIDWMMIPSTKEPREVFRSWDKSLNDTFGKRKFIKLDITNKDVYKSM